MVGEVLRVASLETQRTAAAHKQPHSEQEPGADSLRKATAGLVECCMRRLEASDTVYAAEQQENQGTQLARPEEAAERLVSAAASVGYDALVLVAQEVCRELEAGGAAGGQGGKTDLSRLGAALALAHAMAARPRALASKQHANSAGQVEGLAAVTRAVTRVLAALEEPAADFAGGKRGLQAHTVATHAHHCLGVLTALKAPRALPGTAPVAAA